MKIYQNKDDYLTQKKKFSDEEYLKYYNMGLSDTKIAKLFKCGKTATRYRRMRLGLVANYSNRCKKRQSIDEIHAEIQRRHIRQAQHLKNKLKNDCELKQEYSYHFHICKKRNYAKNRDKIIEQNKQYYKLNRERILLETSIKRRIKKKNIKQDEKSLC